LEKRRYNFGIFKFGVVEVLENNTETLELCLAHCYSQPSRPTGRIPLAPKCQGDHTVRELHCRRTAHRHCAHGTTVAPGLAPPMVSLPYHLRRPPPCLICRYRSKPSPFPPLRAPHHSLCSVTLEPTPRGAASHQPPLMSAALKHRRPRVPSDSSDRRFVHPRATSPRPEDCRGRQSSASFFHGHLVLDSHLRPSFSPPNTSSRTPSVTLVLPGPGTGCP
jgi:hypothetical protein